MCSKAATNKKDIFQKWRLRKKNNFVFLILSGFKFLKEKIKHFLVSYGGQNSQQNV